LAAQGVLVRSGTALGQPGALRVSYGTPAENARFLAVLADVLPQS
jgi:histidinol-phosphate aminotransferase